MAPNIICRDLVTQVETLFSNCERASHAANITPSALKRSFLDKPRQLRGCHWRTEGGLYWTPPEGLTFDKDTIEVTGGSVRAASEDGNSYIYDSVTAAARIRGIDRRSLATAISAEMPFDGATWTVLTTDMGTMGRDKPSAVKVHAESAGKVDPVPLDGSKIIVWDIKTGDETGFKSITKAASSTDISAHAIKTTLLDKPRRAGKFIFRSNDATLRWQPAPYFEFDMETYEKKMSGYIVACMRDGTRLAMYEGPGAAARIEGLDRHSVSSSVKTNKPYKGLLWRPAHDDEVNTFVAVA